MLCVTILFHHLFCVCVPHLSCVYVVTLSYLYFTFVVFTNQSPSHSFHLPQSISSISFIIVQLFHFVNYNRHHFDIYHIWSYSCYIAIQFHFHDISRNMIFLKYIHSARAISRTNYFGGIGGHPKREAPKQGLLYEFSEITK